MDGSPSNFHANLPKSPFKREKYQQLSYFYQEKLVPDFLDRSSRNVSVLVCQRGRSAFDQLVLDRLLWLWMS